MEKYRISIIDRAHNAVTGIEVSRLEGVKVKWVIAEVTSYDGGSAYLTLRKELPYLSHLPVVFLEKKAFESEKEVVLVEDTNTIRPYQNRG